MGYNFILSESEKREILNKHNSYKNFLNENAVAPSIMDIQLKLIKLGFAELLGPAKADGKFGKFTCNAILSALLLLKQKKADGLSGNTTNNMENMPTIIRDCISPTANSESFDSFGTSFIMQTNGTVSPENRQLLFSSGLSQSKNGKMIQLPPFCKIDIVDTDCTSKMRQQDLSNVGGGSSVSLEGNIKLINIGEIKSTIKTGHSINIEVGGTVFCTATMKKSGNMENMPKIKSGNDGTPKEGDGKIPGKIYPMGNEGGNAGNETGNTGINVTGTD
jgi:hypothetical protein